MSRKHSKKNDAKLKFIAAALGLLLLAALSLLMPEVREQLFDNALFVQNADFKVHYIDVGQGDAELIISDDGSTMLIDAGPNSSETSLLNYLTALGIDRLDYVVFTHPHEDHIGGGDYILQNLKVGSVMMPDCTTDTSSFERLLGVIEENGAEFSTPAAGYEFSLGSARVTVLGPVGSGYEGLNNYSLVLRVDYGYTSFLFTGDAEAISEGEMLDKWGSGAFDCDVLKVGHHGSVSSTTDEFLAACSPGTAVIECGRDNSYGHPHRETLEKLTAAGVKIYRTDEDGSVVIGSDGENIYIE